MKKYQIIFALVIWLFFLFSFYLETASSQKKSKVYLEDLNRSVLNFQDILSIPVEKIYMNDFKLWDMKLSNLLKERDKKRLQSDKEKLKSVKIDKPKKQDLNVKYRTICIEKKCWQLMGIMSINGIKTLTLLSKEKRNRLQVFKIGDELLPKIIIKNIKGESMILLNEEKNKEIILKLFDVNISQYLPKTIKEKNE
jgi:hypothetical protein